MFSMMHVRVPVYRPKGTRIAAIVYASEAEVVFNFGDNAAISVDGVHQMLEKIVKVRVDPRSVKSVPQQLKKDGILRGGTATAMALTLAAEVVFASRKSKSQRVVFFITDGMSNIGGSPIKAAQILKRKYSVEIYAIGVGNGGGRRETAKRKRELYDIASDKKGTVIMVKNYAKLLKAINKAVKIEYDTLKLLCGGALVKPGWVLTAAHCLYDKMKRPVFTAGFIIRAGDHELPEEPTQEKQKRVSDVFPHPDYNSKTYENDIALIRLSQPFKLSPSVRLICLPDKSKSLDRPGHGGYVAGWGTTKAYKNINEDPGKYSPVLQQSYFKIQQDELCKTSTSARYKDHVNPDVVFCAGDGKGGNDTCQGDSGGSFMRNAKQGGTHKWVSVGLVSWGEGCGMPNKYGFYTRVEPFLGWINDTIQ
ncbi:hypothetical protein QZH41_005002 [Actinostola sp. cb2023]|nr:hypothetical protein QZH41_005002 [Actinostola sp. cb2023]